MSSKIQFNLLPDVKLRYIKTQRNRNVVIWGAILVSGAALAIFLIMAITVYGVQKKQLSDANKDVTNASNDLKAITGLNKVLTVQNQLQSLVSLHQGKHVTSRIFTYLPQVTPTKVSFSSLALDFSASTMTISGTADSHHTINTFIDTLKFTTYKVGSQDTDHAAFPTVVENSFSITKGQATYSLTVHFDPTLFSNKLLDGQGKAQTPKLTVPKKVTTRSVLNDPGNVLFNGTTGGI